MSKDWVRLGLAIKAARESQGMTQKDLATKAKVSESTVQNFEAGKARTRMPSVLHHLAYALGWTEESAATVLAGGEPSRRVDEDQPRDDQPAPSGLPLRIVQELSDGPLLDTKVLNLSDEDSEARMIVVVKGKQNATPEQIRQALLLWERTEAKLVRGIDTDPDSAVEEA